MKIQNKDFSCHTDIAEDHEIGQYPLVHFENKKEFTILSTLIEKLYFNTLN